MISTEATTFGKQSHPSYPTRYGSLTAGGDKVETTRCTVSLEEKVNGYESPLPTEHQVAVAYESSLL